MHSNSNVSVDIFVQLFCFHYLAFVFAGDMDTFEEHLSDMMRDNVNFYDSSLNYPYKKYDW